MAVDKSRAALLRALYAGRKALGLEEDAFRDVVERVTGERSVAACSEGALRKVLEELRRLGFKPVSRPRPAAGREGMVAKIRAVLRAADRVDGYADAMAQRMFGVERFEWCTPDQLRRIVAALEYDRKRRERRCVGEGPAGVAESRVEPVSCSGAAVDRCGRR